MTKYSQTNKVFFKNQFGLLEANFKLLENESEFKVLPKKTKLVSKGDFSTKIFVLNKGIARAYMETAKGTEINKGLFYPIGFIGSLSSIIQKEPSEFIYETITDCEVYEMDFIKLQNLAKVNRNIMQFYTRILEYIFINREKRILNLISLDAKDRYLALQKEIPNIDNMIPQYHIASYLGITAVQLSRIRKSW